MEKVKIRRRIQNDFQNSIVTERMVSVGAFRKQPNNVFRFADKPGHIVIFTCRRKPFRIMMSAETYSYNYASHLFRRCFPMGFCETVNMHRLEEAARLLKENPKSMMDVADKAGFSTIRSFNSAFKKRFSMTPSEYAQSARLPQSHILVTK